MDNFFANLQKLAISCGPKFAFLMLLPLCGIIKVIFRLNIFSWIFEKRETRICMARKFLHSQYFKINLPLIHVKYSKICATRSVDHNVCSILYIS